MSEVASFRSIQARRSLFESPGGTTTLSSRMSRDTAALAEVRRAQVAEQMKSGQVSQPHRRERSRSLGQLLDLDGGWLPLKMDGYGPSEEEKKELAEKKHRRYSALYPAKASQKIVMEKIYLPGTGATRLSVAEGDEYDSDDDDGGPLSPLARVVRLPDEHKSSVPPELEQSHSEEAGGGLIAAEEPTTIDEERKIAAEEEAEAEDTVRDILGLGVSPALIAATAASSSSSISSTKSGQLSKKPGKRRKTLSIDTRSADDLDSSSKRGGRKKRSSMSGSKTPTARGTSGSRRVTLSGSTGTRKKQLKSRTPRKSTSAVPGSDQSGGSSSSKRVSLSAASATKKRSGGTMSTIRPKVGSRYRLENGDIGICRFYGRTKKARMVGLVIEFGKGDCSGELDGVSYFKCRRNKGRFVTVQQIIEDLGTGSKSLTAGMKRKSLAMKAE